MNTARQLLVVWLTFALAAYCQGNTFKKVRYRGGTIEANVMPMDWGIRLTVSSELFNLELKDRQVLEIDPNSVTSLSYGQEAHRRVGTMIALSILFAPIALFGLFHKTRLHYVGVEYTDTEGKKQGLLLQAHKKNYRAVIFALQGASGAPVSVAENERKFLAVGTTVAIAPRVETTDTAERPIETAQEEAEKPVAGTGVITITSTPEGAEVWVDGDFVGNTPAKVTLSAGKHKIRVFLQGYKEWQREVQVHTDSELTLLATLQKP